MRFSQFFIQRPIFAGVLSAIIFIAGALSLRLLPDKRISRGRAADCRRARDVSRGEPAGHRGDRCVAARAGDQRRRGHALHVVAVDGRRPHDLERDVRARHRSRPGASARAKPRRPSAAEATRGHAAARRRDGEVAAGLHARRASGVAGQPLRHAVSLELRHVAGAGRAQAHRGRRRRAGVRRRRVFDARVARPRKGRGAQFDGYRRRARDPRAERAGRGRPAREPAGAERGAVPAPRRYARAASSPRKSSRTSSSRPATAARSRV